MTAGLQCDYEKNLFFDDQSRSGNGRYRRLILTEEERQLMSEELTAAVPPRLALARINELDEACYRTLPGSIVQFGYGPFGAFRVAAETSPQSAHSTSSAETTSPEQAWHALPTILDEALWSGSCEAGNVIWDQSELDLLGGTALDSTLCPSPERMQEICDNLLVPDLSVPRRLTPPPSAAAAFPLLLDDMNGWNPSPLERNLQGSPDQAFLSEAVSLLKHHTSIILPLLTPFRHSKTPWHTLFIPQVKMCLAGVTLGEEMDHANLCAFYGTLAISALSRAGQSGLHWQLQMAKIYKKMAYKEAEDMIRTIYDVPKKAKYKTTMIALLTMMQLSIVSANPTRTEMYLLEAEDFIRRRGLQKTKSRRVRLLHHCYAFERILFESTRADIGHLLKWTLQESDGQTREQDSPYSPSGDWSNLEHDMHQEKSHEVGENDLHLQMPGEWSATLYPEIFGLSERWLMLISFTVQLARDREGSIDEQGSLMPMKEYLSRAKAIENLILGLQTRPGVDAALRNLFEATHASLCIYFYRKIYDLGPALLQGKVAIVRDCLTRENPESGIRYGTARLVWPAFIAAAEAQDVETRLVFSYWFQAQAQQSGLEMFRTTWASVERSWQVRMKP